MRRRSAGVLTGGEIMEGASPTLAFSDEEIIAALEPFATAKRIARVHQVISARLASVTLVVDALHDPHNGAALVRSCDAFGVQRMHAIERVEALAVATTVSRGTHKWIDILRYESGAACLRALAVSGHELVATHPDGALLPQDLASIPKLALVMGNERDGIADDLRGACSRAVKVPMVGFVESLNVSVTAAILLHAATRGRVGDLTVEQRRALFARALYRTVTRPNDYLDAYRMKHPGRS